MRILKTIEQLKATPPVFMDGFKDLDSVWYNYEIEPQDVNVLFAIYWFGDYVGDAFVLVEKDGELFEVNGSHCSCYGLEDQWKLEETSLIALKSRMANGGLGTEYSWDDEPRQNIFADELLKFITIEHQ